MSRVDYWRECVSEALEDCRLVATNQQIDDIAEVMQGAHEVHDEAYGYDVIKANYISDEAIELEELKAEIEKKTTWKNSTKPCPSCLTVGSIDIGRASRVKCMRCGGKGRIR